MAVMACIGGVVVLRCGASGRSDLVPFVPTVVLHSPYCTAQEDARRAVTALLVPKQCRNVVDIVATRSALLAAF